MLLTATATSALLGGRDAWASPPRTASAAPRNGAAAPAAEAPRTVRIALSTGAADKLSEVRVRRLVDIQLGGAAQVAPEPTGPLDENAVRVFIDLPSPSTATVQVQAPLRRLDVRRVDVAGLPWDVASRFVAIAVSESVRTQLAPPMRPRPRLPTDDEIVAGLRERATIEVGAALVGAFLEPTDDALLGSRLGVTFHQRWLGARVWVAALGAPTEGRWLETGVGVVHRHWWTPDLRSHLGAGFALAFAEDLDAAEELAPWVRGHGEVGLSVRLEDAAWATLALEPGLAYDTERERTGPWVAGSLAVSFDGP